MSVIRDRTSAMETAHSALIYWSAEQGRRGLPTTSRTVDPAWFEDGESGRQEGWSLVCEFDAPPSEQGDPSQARVRFLIPDAPHDRLRPGVRLRLFERASQQCATVEILD